MGRREQHIEAVGDLGAAVQLQLQYVQQPDADHPRRIGEAGPGGVVLDVVIAGVVDGDMPAETGIAPGAEIALLAHFHADGEMPVVRQRCGRRRSSCRRPRRRSD